MKTKVARTADGHIQSAQRPYLDPWQISSDDFPTDATAEEKLWFALNYAVLAPSTHNSQPWRFRIHGIEVDVQTDPARALPIADPSGRELIMSCGAALLHLRLALDYFGYGTHVDCFPEPNHPEVLARVHMGTKGDTQADTILLFQAMQKRRTNRQPFQVQSVPPEVLSALAQAAEAEGAWFHRVETTESRCAVADLVGDADRQQWKNRHFRKELADWIRPSDHPGTDGMSVATLDLGELMAHAGPFIIRTFDLGKGRAAKDRDIALFSPVLAVLGTDSDDPAAWLAAGQALARVLLRAQAEDVSASFLNQPIELPELRPRLGAILGRAGFPQLLLRMGYGEPVKPTPRRPVSAVIISRHSPGTEMEAAHIPSSPPSSDL